MSAAIYVYYRIDPARRVSAREAADRLVEDMRLRHGVSGRLLEKLGEPLLWMEVYDPVADPDRFCAALQAAAEQAGMTRFLAAGSNRHIERFVPLCA
ncbi:MAG TPA: DUF4936 family protein [Burkholderiales bacterium]|nr:DUF4936 family protein [Burkholderiales bacterium]